ncbi:MAG: MFS transporter, partial [Eggerthellaceae bacterium]|nr:MFS transporter [Eggerthellaceae bacterium]
MSFTLVMVVFPPENRGTGMGLVMLITGFGPAIGPTISGVLVDSIGWRMIFILVFAAAVLIIIGGIFLMKNYGNFAPTALDPLSIVFSTVGLVLLLYGLSSFTSTDNYILTIIIIVIGAFFIFLFCRRQLHLEAPMLNITILKTLNFRIGAIICMINIGMLTAMGTLLPLFLQEVCGYSALTTGLVMLPGALIGAFIGLLAARLYDRIGPLKSVLPGVICFVIGGVGGFFYPESTPFVMAVIVYGFLIIGIQYCTTPLNTWGINSLDTRVVQHASAVSSTLNQVGASFLTALVISISALGSVVAPNGTAAEQEYQGDHLA